MRRSLRTGLALTPLLLFAVLSEGRADPWSNIGCGATWTTACHSVRVSYRATDGGGVLSIVAFNSSTGVAENTVLTKALLKVNGTERAELLGAYGYSMSDDLSETGADVTDRYRVITQGDIGLDDGDLPYNVAIIRNGFLANFGACVGIATEAALAGGDLPCGDEGQYFYAMRWDLQIDGAPDWDELRIAMHAQNPGHISDWTTSPGTTTTPEPITMILLGTGLAGVGGAGLVRRRRDWPGVEKR